ncbi:MAG: glycosyltransferase family 4 protein [Myxococcales bacterium]|nr:glycosyltransferase family 4 protein [Myxococcales bacterium]
MDLTVVTGIFPPDIGGPASYVPQLAAALTNEGHRLRVVTYSETEVGPSFPFEVTRIPRGRRRWARMGQAVAAIIRAGRRSDVLLVNGLALQAACANLILRKPLVMKVVGDIVWERAQNRGEVSDTFEEFQVSRYSRRVEAERVLQRWWVQQADKVIVPSRFLGRCVAAWGVPAHRIEVVYNAIEFPASLARAEIPLASPLKVCTVARLVPWKNVAGVLKAVASLADVGLVVVGDGPERKRLEAIAVDLGIRHRTFFAGGRSRPEVLSLLRACDIFVLNSSYEGFAHALVEAMCLGLPVVATTAGGNPEVVVHGENGLLIPPLADGELIDALATLTRSATERERLGHAATEVAARLSPAAMVRSTRAILEAARSRKA